MAYNFKPYTPAQRAQQTALVRAGHPNISPRNAGFIPSPNQATVHLAAAASKPKPTTTQKQIKVADPMTRITNRLIADMLTPKQQQAQAASSVDAQIKIALAGMRSSTLAAQQQANQQAERAQNYAMALGSMRDLSGAQTEADYQNAAARIQGLGTGLTSTVAEAQQAGANDAAARIAAATQGLGTAKGLDVAGLQNIAQYTGVTMPATNLYSEAASQAAQSRLSQDVRAAKVGQIAQDYLQKGTEAQQELQRKRTELETTRPSLYQTAISNLKSGGRSDVATIISALALQNTAAKTPSEIAKNVAGAKATTAGAAATTGKTFGHDAKGNLAGGFYYGGPGKTQTTKIPTDWRLFTEGTGAEKTHLIVPKGAFFWKGTGHTNPQPIPKNYMLDPKDPTNHTIKPNPAAVSQGGKTPGEKTQALIKTWSDTVDKSILAPNSPYTHDVADPYEVAKGYAKPRYVPSMTYAQAFASLLAKVPPGLQKNAQMIANINGSLQRAGYKIPTGGTKKTTVKKKPTTTVTKSGGRVRVKSTGGLGVQASVPAS
jgi:hypothetical protein